MDMRSHNAFGEKTFAPNESTINCRSVDFVQMKLTICSYFHHQIVTPFAIDCSRGLLELHQSTGIEGLGTIKWDMALCLAAVYIICYFSLWKGISTSGKVRMHHSNAHVIVFTFFCSCSFNYIHSACVSMCNCLFAQKGRTHTQEHKNTHIDSHFLHN